MSYDSNEPQPGRFHEEHYDPFRKSSPSMASAARLLSILSIIFCWMIYLAIPIAAAAVILALLSRGGEVKISHRIRSIIVTAVTGMILSGTITGYAFYTVYSSPELKARLDQVVSYYMQEYYGISDSNDTEQHWF